MIRFLAALTALFIATAATAQDFPAMYRVTGVASHDVLNIRAEPTAQAPILDSFGRTQTHIEVVGLSQDRRWGMVRTQDGIGWSFMRYLQRERSDSWRDGQQPLTCYGTEPFWNLNLFLPSNRAEFEDLASGGFELRNNAPNLSFTRHPATLAMSFNGARRGFATIRQGVCSDGMSDHLYGLEVQIYWHGQNAGQSEGLSGCCMLGH